MQLRLLRVFATRTLEIGATGLILRPPVSSDFEKWRTLRQESKTFLQPWEPLWPEDDLTWIGYRRRIKSYSDQWQRGSGQTYFLFDRDRDVLMGGVSLTRIRHGRSRSGMIGYWMGKSHAGKGHMTRAVDRILEHAFNSLNLVRIEAACLPSNKPSRSLLERNRFQEEGFAREYLEINGRREDHVLYAILRSDWRMRSE